MFTVKYEVAIPFKCQIWLTWCL